MPELSIFDERLAEIDRRLRMIQSGLEPVAPVDTLDVPMAPPEPLPAPTPLRAARVQAEEPAELLARLNELQDAHERLLELHRELLSQYAEVLESRVAGPAGAGATVTAGPFSSAAAVRQFEQVLAALPGVGAVAVREYLGADRVALDVRLVSR